MNRTSRVNRQTIRGLRAPAAFLVAATIIPVVICCENQPDNTLEDALDANVGSEVRDQAQAEETVEEVSGSTDSTSNDARQFPGGTVCVWNQAYQENTEPDSVAAIRAAARDCYVLLDPFDAPAAASAIGELKANGNTVGCYMSVGTCEDWRDDFDDVSGFCSDTEWGDWEGEYFVEDTDGIAPFMRARIDQFASWGCDMVEFDNMDWAWEAENYDLDIGVQQSIRYYQALCDHVHELGMGCMAKNTRDGGEAFDGGTFESYPDDLDWWEHDHLQSFVDEGKLAVVFHYDEPNCVQATQYYQQRYGDGLSVLCEDPGRGGYSH